MAVKAYHSVIMYIKYKLAARNGTGRYAFVIWHCNMDGIYGKHPAHKMFVFGVKVERLCSFDKFLFIGKGCCIWTRMVFSIYSMLNNFKLKFQLALY
jgi:hypothetical protein